MSAACATFDAVTFADVTASAVINAVGEFKRLGREKFLESAEFGPATAYFLELDGELYDSKAIFGYAHGVSGDRAWRSGDFTGGDATVAKHLRELGFTVRYLRNPNWTRDEIILACAAAEANNWKTLAQESRRAIDLSQLLQSPAIHPLEGRRADFRNPAGIERKVSDIITCHPDYKGKRTNGNHLDGEVLTDFLERPAEMRALAETIKNTLLLWDDSEPAFPDPDLSDDMGVEEGGVLLKVHLRRERDPKLKRKKIAEARKAGVAIACEACGFDFYRTYGARGLDYIECHHRTPLSVTGKTRTRSQDLALVCSNCHRMIHRTAQWLTVADLRALVEAQRVPEG
jgi:5-methylcytosine-specific restriction protein A